MVEFNLDAVEGDVIREEGGGKPKVQEGRGHFLIIGAEEAFDYIKVAYEVLAYSDEEGVGQHLQERFYTNGKYAHRGVLLARACGIISDDEIKISQAKKLPLVFSPESLYAKTFCCSIKHRAGKNGGMFANLGWDFLSPVAGKAAEYPVDEEFVKAVGAEAADVPF